MALGLHSAEALGWQALTIRKLLQLRNPFRGHARERERRFATMLLAGMTHPLGVQGFSGRFAERLRWFVCLSVCRPGTNRVESERVSVWSGVLYAVF